MASVIIAIDLGPSYTGAGGIYAVVRNSSQAVRVTSGGAFVTYIGANYSTYATAALMEQGANGYFALSSIILADGDTYVVSFHQRGIMASPAESDPRVGVGSIDTGVERAPIADKLLGRNLAGGSDGGRTVQDSLRAGRNKVAFDVPGVGQFTVYQEDDTTTAWTGTYTRGLGGPLTITDPT